MSNTVEELVDHIRRTGRRDPALMLELWQRVRPAACRLVNHYGRSCAGSACDAEDLLQECFLALYDAVEHYDPEQGSFIGYAPLWMRSRLSHAVNSQKGYTMPEAVQLAVWRYRKTVSEYEMMHGHRPADNEIGRLLGLSEEELAMLRRAAQAAAPVRLDAPVSDDDGETTMADLIPAAVDLAGEVIEARAQEELASALWGLVDKLEPAAGHALHLRYEEDLSFRETAERLDLSVNEVRRTEERALRQLRKPANRRQLSPFLEEERVLQRAFRSGGPWNSPTERTALRLLEMRQRSGEDAGSGPEDPACCGH